MYDFMHILVCIYLFIHKYMHNFSAYISLYIKNIDNFHDKATATTAPVGT